jgi:hypothetical protein
MMMHLLQLEEGAGGGFMQMVSEIIFLLAKTTN